MGDWAMTANSRSTFLLGKKDERLVRAQDDTAHARELIVILNVAVVKYVQIIQQARTKSTILKRTNFPPQRDIATPD